MMPLYQYAGRDQRGNAVSGRLAAVSVEALADELRRTGCFMTAAQELSEQAAAASRASAPVAGGRVSYDDLLLFSVQLSKMVQVGIPLLTGLETLQQQMTNRRFRAVIADIAKRVQGGDSLSEAMGCYPRVFPPLFLNMVRAGEASGKLDEILRRLADFAKHQAQLREQLLTATMYPITLLVTGIAVGIFLLVGIIPKFMKIYLEADVPLPLPTMILHQLSVLVRHYWLLLAAGAALALYGARLYVETPAGRRQVDRLSLRVPVLGELVRRAAVSRFAWTLCTLFTSGVPILESLAIAETTCGNAVIAEACHAAAAHVKEGGSLAEPLRASREFPPMVVQMVSVGETAGSLDEMLEEVAAHYDELVQHGIKRVMALVEPVFLLVMGGMVALIMASLLLPMFRLVNVVR